MHHNMTQAVSPTAVAVVIPLAKVPEAPVLIAEGIPAEIVDAGEGSATLNVSYDGENISWVALDDSKTLVVQIDANESSLTISVRTDEQIFPEAIGVVRHAVCDRFGCEPAESSPTYVVELSVASDHLIAELDCDSTFMNSDNPSNVNMSYTYNGVTYLIRNNGVVEIRDDITDPGDTINAFATHINSRFGSD